MDTTEAEKREYRIVYEPTSELPFHVHCPSGAVIQFETEELAQQFVRGRP